MSVLSLRARLQVWKNYCYQAGEYPRTLIIYLGGSPADRLDALLLAMRDHPYALVLLSTPERPTILSQYLQHEGISPIRVLMDYRGWDTVSQFTRSEDVVRAVEPWYIKVVTSDYHMERSLAIAETVHRPMFIAYGLTGIEGHESRTGEPDEPWTARLRALIWRWTGWLPHSKRIRAEREAESIALWREQASKLPEWAFREGLQ